MWRRLTHFGYILQKQDRQTCGFQPKPVLERVDSRSDSLLFIPRINSWWPLSVAPYHDALRQHDDSFVLFATRHRLIKNHP